jgi:hypothetical protein
MTFKKRLIWFAFQFPITLIVAVGIYFAYSMQVHDQPTIDWVAAVAIAVALDALFTWRHTRHEKHEEKVS